MGEPFEKIVIDCVGPLPWKSGHTYLLTMMCAATRYPRAIPLSSIKSRAIIKSLVKFFYHLWVTKIHPSRPRLKFYVHVFWKVMTQLHIHHQLSKVQQCRFFANVYLLAVLLVYIFMPESFPAGNVPGLHCLHQGSTDEPATEWHTQTKTWNPQRAEKEILGLQNEKKVTATKEEIQTFYCHKIYEK